MLTMRFPKIASYLFTSFLDPHYTHRKIRSMCISKNLPFHKHMMLDKNFSVVNKTIYKSVIWGKLYRLEGYQSKLSFTVPVTRSQRIFIESHLTQVNTDSEEYNKLKHTNSLLLFYYKNQHTTNKYSGKDVQLLLFSMEIF